MYTFKKCFAPDGSELPGVWEFITPPGGTGPSLTELAWEAFGELSVPDFTLAHSPPVQAVIFVDTWWWAEGPSDGEVRGSSAGGVVAIAEPSRLEVDPGDGSGVLDCPFTVRESDACSHVYDRASVNGTARTGDGLAAHPARARLVYTVRFENNGAPLTLPGLPEALESEWQETPVRVTEVQAVVR
ncbi:hypothetical protein FNX48_025505 [Streptomyces sp. IF17]|uniref:Uncharacterized protein n=1 Tax=Streptomyces alkaliphilus TaxID=1472722 RepID=A0A646IKP4_9ACTN|nr:hypothetical protein [Streptomyces alkaliphilus]